MPEMSEQYAGYKWIKVKRSEAVEINGEKYVSEKHHVEETTFLIEEVRRLAKQIDELKKDVS